MLSDIEIAQSCRLRPVADVASAAGLAESDIDQYGVYKAKITFPALRQLQKKALASPGKLILVTAVTPTPAGEGKSTVSIGLGDGLCRIGKNAVIALREPSLGPCFGVKGGACGGGYAQIVPMEDINLHFTGDIHAVSITANFIASLIDNHLYHGNKLGIDARTVSWRRCVDLNDRALRHTVIGLGGKAQGVPREQQFCIAVASEVMAVLCLSRSISELKQRLDDIVIGCDFSGRFVRFGELGCTGAAAALLKDALRPNLVQTLEGTPVFVHGGPFANIAHGCNSINATQCALALGDYVVTEAGFAADLGAEKFFDIKCRISGLQPDAVVIVATVRALKMHGGIAQAQIDRPDVAAVQRGFSNLSVHIENVLQFGVHPIVAINRFNSDSAGEIAEIEQLCAKAGVQAVVCESWEHGGEGAAALAEAVVTACSAETDRKTGMTAGFHVLYPNEMPLTQKIETIARRIYRAAHVEFTPAALKKLSQYTAAGFGNLPVCIAKTQNSISHDKTLIGAPSGYRFPVTDAQLYAGAGFVVALAGDIMTMPGLPAAPAALHIDVDDDGKISGLF